ncbi:MAG: transporter [Candidatus Competibacter sp.]
MFPALSGLDPLVGGNATLGQSVVDSTLTSRLSEFNLAYGLTNKLTLVVKVPYGYIKNEIRADLDASQANVGRNPLFGTPSDPFRSPLIPIAAGGIRLSDEDIQNLLGNGLDLNRDGVTDIPGYGYKRFETFSDNGIGDIELYAKYQFYDQNPWRLAVASGLRFPTGKVKDIDNLAALDFGDGQTDILFRFHADYGVSENLQLNFTTRYDLQLPDRQTLRVPHSVDQPITRDIEEVDRNLGDVFGLDLIGLYQFEPEWSASLRYSFTRKFQDDVDGDLGLTYSSLEQESESENQRVAVTLGYSTLQRYQDKMAKIPFYANLTYRSRFAGKNTVVSQYISLNIGVLF